MSEPKTKMTLLLTPAERARLDALRLARGDRHASATLRALVRDAGGDTPRAPAGMSPVSDARLDAALDLLAALPARAPRRPAASPPTPGVQPTPAPDPLDTAEDDGADAYALLILEEARRSAPAALVAELGDRLPTHPAAAVAALIVQALPCWAGLDPGGDPPDPLRPAHVRGAARAARALADALERIAERA